MLCGKKCSGRVVDAVVGMAGVLFWLVIAVILFVIEGMTTQLVCIWFALGALVTTFVAYAKGPMWFQMLMFLVFSVVVLLIGRPILKDKIQPRKQPTNSDMAIGQVAIVTETIDNVAQTGRATVLDLSWMARTEYQQTIPAGTRVVVQRIEGAKLIVAPVEEIGEIGGV